MAWADSEATVRARLDAGRVREAVEALLQAHDSELYDYVARLVGDEALAEDAYQVFAVRLWQALESFRWRSSLKTWTYTIARNAAYRGLDDPFRRRAQRLGTADQQALAVSWTRDTTARWRQTREKARLWAAVEALAAPERELVVLRLGRRLSWKEVAAIVHGDEPDADARLTQLAAAARKRFERIKGRLQDALEVTP